MRNILFILCILSCSLISCEDVIDVDLDQSEPRLVVEASIIWNKDTDGNQQSIKLSKTTGFYAQQNTPVVDAEIRVSDENGRSLPFRHQENGVYTTSYFQPIIGMTYTLEIRYENEIYTAKEQLTAVSSIDFVEQTAEGGFNGDDIEIKAYYTDPPNEQNFYLFKFYTDKVNLEFYEDEFTNGNQIFGYYSSEELEPNDLIEIEIQGISKKYYEYLFILRSQIGTNEGGPFETMPSMVKGNIVNQTNKENYPFGYFRLSEADSISYQIQ